MFVIAKTQRDLSLGFLTRAGSYTRDPLDALRFVTRESATQRAGLVGTVIPVSEVCALPSVVESREAKLYSQRQS
jgi:hypothetical protein